MQNTIRIKTEMEIRKILKFIFLILIIIPVTYYFIYSLNMRNPFSDVQWVENYPGATDRYVTYTPVLKSNTKIKLGPEVGADFGKLRFKDLNNDGIKEAIIETEILFDFGEFRSPERHILKYRKGPKGLPEFVLIKSEKFPEKIPDIYTISGK